MSKELTPLEALTNIRELVNDVQYASKIPSIANELDIIETALKQYDKILTEFDIYAKVLNTENKLKALETLQEIVSIDFEREVGDDLVCVGISGTSKINKETLKELKEVLL